MHYSDSLENIGVILTIHNIHRQSLHHYTPSSYIANLFNLIHRSLRFEKRYFYRCKDDQFWPIIKTILYILSVENTDRKMADLNRFHSYKAVNG